MSLKLSDFTLATDLLGTDWVTGLDNSAPVAQQNVKITKDNLLKAHALKTETQAVQTDLDNHKGTNAATAHPDGTTLTDLNNHKSGADQHPISGVTGLQSALDAKANTADLGNSASRDVGTLNSQVPPGDEPANAVAGHESSFDHTRIQTPNQKAAADAANLPSGANPYATINDVPPGGSTLHADLTDTDSDGHPGTVINIAGGVQGNAVSIAADGTLQDSGVPPGGAGGTTDLGTIYTGTTFDITSSSGQDTTVAQAIAGSNAGAMSGADKSKLDGIQAGAEVNAVDDVSGTNSINVGPTTGNVVVSLEGDAASPGDTKYWGTSGVGAKGFHDFPAPQAHATSHVTGADQITTFGAATRGLVPASGGGTTNFLRADGQFAAPPGGGGGWDDGSTITDWGDTGQTITGSGAQTLDLDSGHFFSGTLTASKTITFESTAAHGNTSWDVILATGGNTPTWAFTGATVHLPDGYDISANATYWFTFRKVGADVYVSERKMQ